MPVPTIIFIVLVIIGFCALVAWGSGLRRKEMAEWAAAHGLHFHHGTDKGMRHRFPEFQCLREGNNRYAEHIISGEWKGRPVLAFDYHYETYSRNSKGHRQTHHHRFSAIILETDLPLKPLFIRPETFLDKITEFVGLDDIDFESAEFSRRFYVKAEDKRWAYDVIHTRTMERLLARPDYTIQFGRRGVMVRKGARFAVPLFTEAIDVAHDLLDGLPDYLVRQLQEQYSFSDSPSA